MSTVAENFSFAVEITKFEKQGSVELRISKRDGSVDGDKDEHQRRDTDIKVFEIRSTGFYEMEDFVSIDLTRDPLIRLSLSGDKGWSLINKVYLLDLVKAGSKGKKFSDGKIVGALKYSCEQGMPVVCDLFFTGVPNLKDISFYIAPSYAKDHSWRRIENLGQKIRKMKDGQISVFADAFSGGNLIVATDKEGHRHFVGSIPKCPIEEEKSDDEKEEHEFKIVKKYSEKYWLTLVYSSWVAREKIVTMINPEATVRDLKNRIGMKGDFYVNRGENTFTDEQKLRELIKDTGGKYYITLDRRYRVTLMFPLDKEKVLPIRAKEKWTFSRFLDEVIDIYCLNPDTYDFYLNGELIGKEKYSKTLSELGIVPGKTTEVTLQPLK